MPLAPEARDGFCITFMQRGARAVKMMEEHTKNGSWRLQALPKALHSQPEASFISPLPHQSLSICIPAAPDALGLVHNDC